MRHHRKKSSVLAFFSWVSLEPLPPPLPPLPPPLPAPNLPTSSANGGRRQTWFGIGGPTKTRSDKRAFYSFFRLPY